MAREGGLTLRAIRDWVGDREIAKGRPYADDAVTGAVRSGDELKANVQGTRDRPYRVRVRLQEGQVVSDECSCPVGDRCKHVAAVLLAYHDDPDRFAVLADLDATLRAKDKAELVALIKLMVRRAPELEPLLAAPVPGFGKASADPALYRRQALDVIRGMDPYDEWSGDEIASGLGEVLAIGRAFEDAKDPAAATAVYQGVAAAVAEEEIDYLDGGEGGDVSGDLAAGLIRALGREPAGTPRRESLLRSLYELLRVNGSLGANEDGDDQLDDLLAGISPGERRTLSGWLRQSARSEKGDAFGSEYASRRAADLLLRVDADVMDDAAYLDHCRRFGLRRDLIGKLLELGRADEAVTEVAAVPAGGDVLHYCDLLVSHRLGAEAERIVRQRKGWEKDAYLVRWLRERAAGRKDAAEAAWLTAALLEIWPSADLLADLKKWTPAADWPGRRSGLLKKLEKDKRYGLLIDIYLKEGEVAQLLRILKLDRHSGHRLQVAKAAEATHPVDAIEIYRTAAERVLENRDRAAYAEACKHLEAVGRLMSGLGRADEFRQYVAGLAEEHRALRAFQEELRKAKLLSEVPPTAVKLKGKRPAGK